MVTKNPRPNSCHFEVSFPAPMLRFSSDAPGAFYSREWLVNVRMPAPTTIILAN